jgi:hypothetical protein
MARLTPDQWAAARVAWESDPKASYESVGAAFGVSKQSVWKHATADGWKKSTSTPAINDAANRRADAVVNPLKGDAVDGKLDAAPPTEIKPEKMTDPASDEESIRKRATIVACHREETGQLGLILRAARGVIVHAVNLTGSGDEKKAAWARAKLAQAAARDAVAAAAQRHQMERRAWGLDIVVDPDQLRSMSDEDLELLAAGKLPRGFS